MFPPTGLHLAPAAVTGPLRFLAGLRSKQQVADDPKVIVWPHTGRYSCILDSLRMLATEGSGIDARDASRCIAGIVHSLCGLNPTPEGEWQKLLHISQ